MACLAILKRNRQLHLLSKHTIRIDICKDVMKFLGFDGWGFLYGIDRNDGYDSFNGYDRTVK